MVGFFDQDMRSLCAAPHEETPAVWLGCMWGGLCTETWLALNREGYGMRGVGRKTPLSKSVEKVCGHSTGNGAPPAYRLVQGNGRTWIGMTMTYATGMRRGVTADAPCVPRDAAPTAPRSGA
jgi:hypothetical protein